MPVMTCFHSQQPLLILFPTLSFWDSYKAMVMQPLPISGP